MLRFLYAIVSSITTWVWCGSVLCDCTRIAKVSVVTWPAENITESYRIHTMSVYTLSYFLAHIHRQIQKFGLID